MNEKRKQLDREYVALILQRIEGELFAPTPEQLARMIHWPVCDVRRYVKRHYPKSAKRYLMRIPHTSSV